MLFLASTIHSNCFLFVYSFRCTFFFLFLHFGFHFALTFVLGMEFLHNIRILANAYQNQTQLNNGYCILALAFTSALQFVLTIEKSMLQRYLPYCCIFRVHVELHAACASDCTYIEAILCTGMKEGKQ